MKKLNDREVQILRSVAHAPKSAHSLTHAERGVGDLQVAPHVIQLYLDHLTELGLIAEPAKRSGDYTVTEEGQAYLANIPQIASGTLVCAASMPQGSYKPKPWPVRDGGEKHKEFKSLTGWAGA